MSQHSVVNVGKLEKGFVLAPERYDPRRSSFATTGVTIADAVDIVQDLVNKKKASSNSSYLILDTSDAYEGTIRTIKSPVSGSEIGSTKKQIRCGDVIISRLRPYLRQVALVDSQFLNNFDDNVTLLCSTEFFVLRSRDASSIAYLVPLLLSEKVQVMLSASQEGGHHPRFNLKTLQSVSIPTKIWKNRSVASKEVLSSIHKIQSASANLQAAIRSI